MSHLVRPPCDEAVIRCGHEAAEAARQNPTWVLVTAILASSMAFIDGTVVNVALPSVQRDLGAGAAEAEWVVEAYTLLLSSLLLVGGALGDRLGRRRVFATGVALFAVTSAACGLAPSAGVLIGARALQGAAAALLMPGSLALISAAYSGARRGRAIGTWSGASAITAAIGPVLGGFLVGHFSWRWAFFINLPLAAVALLLALTRVPESVDPEARGRLDWPGAGLASAGLGAVVYAVIRAQGTSGFDAASTAGLVGGLVALAAFLWRERALTRAARAATGGGGSGGRARRLPMLSLDLFRSRAFSATNGLTLLLYAPLGGALFFVPFDLIEVHHYSPAAAGASLLPMVLLLSVLSRWAGGLVGTVGARLPLTVGPLVAAGGFALFALPGSGGSYWTTFFPASAVLGLGMAITVAPLTTTVMGSVPSTHAGAASGVNNAVARVAGLLAIALLGTVMVRGFASGLEQRLDAMHLPAAARQQMVADEARLALVRVPAGLSATQRAQAEAAVDDAFVGAFRETLAIAAGLAVAGGLVGALGVPGSLRHPGAAADDAAAA
jgi:EmrB/QacA subfamily drug resistance transporter